MTRSLGSTDTERFRGIIARRLGFGIDDAKLVSLAELLRRRLEITPCSNEQYLAKLEAGAPHEELRVLARELTVGETYFFRNNDQFCAFQEIALTGRLRSQNSTKCLRILSAGCASGEEAYTIAILIREAMMDSSWNVSVRGIDINPAALDKAVRARYTNWALRETPPPTRRKWFHQDGQDAILDADIRNAVKFEERNLMDDDPGFWQEGAYDIIFCRNVLMYFTADNARAVTARIARALAPGGYLFLGHAETLRGLSQDFHLRHTHNTFYYQRKASVDDEFPASVPSFKTTQSAVSGPMLAAIVENAETWVDAIRRASERVQILTQTQAPTASSMNLRPQQDLGLALDLLQKERFTEALDLVQSFPAESANDPDVLLLHAALLAHSGALARAEDACRRLLSNNELNAGAHYLLALCREGVGDQAGAIEQNQIAIYLDPAFAMPHLHLGLLARRAANRELARRELAQALLLLQSEDASRLLLFGGGFNRETLLALCRAELHGCGGSA